MAVDLNVMATNIKTVISGVSGILSTFDHEPQNISQLPAATLFFDSFTQSETTTRRSSVEWKWTIRIYIDLNTSDIQGSQTNLRNLITNTLKQLRENVSLQNSCLYHTVSNGDVFAIMNQNKPMMVAELTLTATTEESM